MIPKEVQDRINYHIEALKFYNENRTGYDMDDVSFKNIMNRHNKAR